MTVGNGEMFIGDHLGVWGGLEEYNAVGGNCFD